jgi:uncharacterized protein YecE (DUF72 family)
MAGVIRVGCAGWSLPRAVQPSFPEGASHLERYAGRFSATEINSSFHRPHARGLYEKWAAATPPSFRFSAKLPKAITHERRLADCAQPLREFLDQSAGLGDRLAVLLVQLPPSLHFDPAVAADFFALLREHHPGHIAVEPRHASWFTAEADALLRRARAARVLADPVRHDAGRWPGGWPGLVYLRLHGSPRMYYSAYEAPVLQALAARLRLASLEAEEAWCIFDNTAAGAATADALLLQSLLDEGR